MKPGQEARVDYEYIRHGMVNIFMENEPLEGKSLVMDNYSMHAAASFYKPEEAKRLWNRFEFVYTPKHGSWLNMAEIELHVLNGQCLKRHIASTGIIKKEVNAWQLHRNNVNSKNQLAVYE